MEDSQDPSIFELNAVCATEEAAIQFCREEGLIPSPSAAEAPGLRPNVKEYWGVCGEIGFNPALPNCDGNVTTMQRMFKNGPKPQYRCCKCRRQRSQQHSLAPVGGTVRETLFSGMDRAGRPNGKISKRGVLWILYAMAKELSLNHTVTLAGDTIPLSRTAVVGWRGYVRAVMMEALECSPRMGGPGHTVQIGRFLFRADRLRRLPQSGSSPGHSGAAKEGPWVLGLLHEETDELRLFLVEEPGAAAFLPVIVANVAPGSVIHSDGRTAYGDRLRHCRDTAENGGGAMGYSHYESNPETGVTVQQLRWKIRRCKTQLLRLNKGTSRALLPGHLAAFWWASLHGPAKCRDPFLRLVALLRKRFPQE